MRKKKEIYLDNAANTAIDPRVAKKMAPYLDPSFCGNSHSPHSCGAKADTAIYEAREEIAKALKVKPEEVYFTSGATESNNWVIKSLALHELEKPASERRGHIVCSAIEHASVLNACKDLEKLGFSVTYVKPSLCGKIGKTEVAKALTKKTLLVCCMCVNNETGVSNDVDMIAAIAHKFGALMLSDFTQAMLLGDGSIRIGTTYAHVDYVSFSGHKIHGPTGIGCLIKREDVPLYPLLHGGSQENGLRGGTHNTAAIVGLGEAVRILSESRWNDFFEKLYFRLLRSLYARLPKCRMNAHAEHRNIASYDFSKCTSLTNIVSALSAHGICCSSGAACSATDDGEELSHVLQAMEVSEESIKATVRISFSRFNTKHDVDALVDALCEICAEFPK